MPALETGSSAPEIRLPTLDGGNFSLSEARKQGPVALAFFKVSCPVCQMAFPFFERLHQAFRGKNVHVIGISQDSAKDTASFAKRFGINKREKQEGPQINTDRHGSNAASRPIRDRKRSVC